MLLLRANILCFHWRNIFKYRSVRAKKTVDLEFNIGATKGGFFQKVRFVFQISKKDIPKNYPELEI